MLHRAILVAEEDGAVRRMMRVNLECAGLGVYEAARYSHLAYLLLTYPATLVVLSLTLPGLPPLGPEWSARFSRGRHPVPLLATSAEPGHRALALQLGAEFLRKPFDPGELVQQVLRLLRSSRGSQVLMMADPGGG